MAHSIDGAGQAPEEILSLQARNLSLQALVGELLTTNQELRFKVEQLERQAEKAARARFGTLIAAALPLP